MVFHGSIALGIMVAMITTARSYIGLSLDELQSLLGDAARAVHGDEYGQMQDLTSIENLTVFPGTLYLWKGAVRLVRLNHTAVVAVSPADLRLELGNEPVRLRSSAGKRAHLWLWAEQGVACSVEDETIHYLEVFEPCSQAEYEARIYREPPHFIR